MRNSVIKLLKLSDGNKECLKLPLVWHEDIQTSKTSEVFAMINLLHIRKSVASNEKDIFAK